MPKLLTRLRIDEVSAVDAGAGEGVRILLMKRARADEPYWKREFSEGERRAAASSGAAESDGSFPIKNASDLHNAMRAIGRSKNPGKTRAHIRARARALGLTSELSDAFKREDRHMSKFKDFFVGKRTANDEIAKSTAALAESVGSIIASDGDVETKNKALTETFEQFQEHLERNIVAGPAPDKQGDKTMLKELAKMLGLKEDASEEDISKAIAARDLEINILKAGMTDEEKGYHDVLSNTPDQESFRKLDHDGRKKLMHKRDELPEYVRKLISDGEEAQKRVAKLEEAQELQVFEKMATEHGLATTAAPKLMKMEKADPEGLKELLQRIKGDGVALKNAGLFKEIGGTGAGATGVTAYDEIKAKAAELRKTDPKLTEAQAFAKVYEDPANIEIAKRERTESRVVVNPPGTMA